MPVVQKVQVNNDDSEEEEEEEKGGITQKVKGAIVNIVKQPKVS